MSRVDAGEGLFESRDGEVENKLILYKNRK
jgi:hypothetical protein